MSAPVMSGALLRFAEEIGPEGPVCVAGGRSHWGLGGLPAPGTCEVAAPAGLVKHEPGEMIVRTLAGTSVVELQAAVAERGQMVNVYAADRDSTVGGVLAVGHSGYARLRYGPVRDSLLEARFVSSAGKLVRAGAPLVKNVTGFDLCRLLVGSLGTLGLLGEVVLRCLPMPESRRWWVAEKTDPFRLLSALYRPTAILWDGQCTWVGMEGQSADLDWQESHHLAGFAEVEGPPALPQLRRSLEPSQLRGLPLLVGSAGRWLAEIGVGTVHLEESAAVALGPPAAQRPDVEALSRSVKQRFDPAGRLNPGRDPLRR